VTKVEVLLPVGFAGADADEWTRPRGFPRPDALDRAVDVLPGVGPAVKKKLQRLGLETVGDLLTHRPFRYEEPVPERRIADLQGDEDVAITARARAAFDRCGRRNGIRPDVAFIRIVERHRHLGL